MSQRARLKEFRNLGSMFLGVILSVESTGAIGFFIHDTIIRTIRKNRFSRGVPLIFTDTVELPQLIFEVHFIVKVYK